MASAPKPAPAPEAAADQTNDTQAAGAAAPADSLEQNEQDRADEPRAGNPVHQYYVKDGGQSVGDIAEAVLGDNTPENRHHIWDWNRNQIASPEATVPGGNILRIASPEHASGGPPLHTLKNGALTDQELANATTTGDKPKADAAPANRALTRDMTPGRPGMPVGKHVPEGSSGSEAQARQDRREVEGAGAAGDDDFQA